MSRTPISLCALLWPLATGLAWSQPAEPVPAPPAKAEPAGADTPASPTGVYEEIEILRRLLNQGLEAAYGLPAHGVIQRVEPGIPGTVVHRLTDVHHQLSGAEGVYVKGCGVVFSATLPPPSRSPLPVAPPAAPAAPTPWDQARAELRGEKLRTPEAGVAGRQAPLAEAILRVLAENGRHFRHLPDGESIAVALTFRRLAACSQCHSAGSNGPVVVGRQWQGNLFTVAASPGAAPEVVQTANRTEPDATPKEVLMGDLHVKQRRLDEAAKAYTEGLRAFEQSLQREKERTGAYEVKTLLATVDVANKLAQLYTTQGDHEKAVQMVKAAAQAAARAEEAAQGKPVPAGAVPLPSRLVVTAPKKILDQVGAGKISFEDFRKAAAVEYLTFPVAEKVGTKTPPAARP